MVLMEHRFGYDMQSFSQRGGAISIDHIFGFGCADRSHTFQHPRSSGLTTAPHVRAEPLAFGIQWVSKCTTHDRRSVGTSSKRLHRRWSRAQSKGVDSRSMPTPCIPAPGSSPTSCQDRSDQVLTLHISASSLSAIKLHLGTCSRALFIHELFDKDRLILLRCL